MFDEFKADDPMFHGRVAALIAPARSGKDHCLAAGGFSVVSLSHPLDELIRGAAGEIDRTAPGYRRTQQLYGQWGRGYVSEEYPITTERVAWLRWVGDTDSGGLWLNKWKLDFRDIGTPRFWADGAFKRASAQGRAAVGNLRFRGDVDAAVAYHALVGTVLTGTDVIVSRVPESERANLGSTEPSEALAWHYRAAAFSGNIPVDVPLDFVVINDARLMSSEAWPKWAVRVLRSRPQLRIFRTCGLTIQQ